MMSIINICISKAHLFASKCISRLISRGGALLEIAVYERHVVWRQRKLRWCRVPTEQYALLFKDLRRILYIIVQLHPYLQADVGVLTLSSPMLLLVCHFYCCTTDCLLN